MLDQPDTDALNIGFNFDNSYQTLPKTLYSRTKPEEATAPYLIVLNEALAEELGLSISRTPKEVLEGLFSGNITPEGTQVISQSYAGHQFGGFTNLGDGRAHLLGEHVTPAGKRVDIQFKGSGRTPYSRSGDGKAALGPMLREYIISEALHALNILTTRSLAVTTTGDPVIRNEMLPGAVLTRVATSHIRVGTFQYLQALKDEQSARALADYVITRHYPHLSESQDKYLKLLEEVMDRQIKLITNWMRVGFIHGVMNTDNMLICGDTIDYGPCAFMDHYSADKVFSSIDRYGRYAFSNQSKMAHWNLTRFAETLLPLFHEDEDKAIEKAEKLLMSFGDKFDATWLKMMTGKLGLGDVQEDDKALVNGLLDWMEDTSVDYTNTFTDLTEATVSNDPIYQSDRFSSWYQVYSTRKEQDSLSDKAARELMKQSNPVYIPRNHKVEEALYSAERNGDLSLLHALLDVIKQPYHLRDGLADYQQPPTEDEAIKHTFCGT
ncbi:YdiU family protein [Terasakiella sp. A23]|uniref:protein adenylyltransferase SelO n=1 Tax=Terasakiella sp. FCG-A23 TaxID=3080561 RepID=UPI002952A574|nr:YdiU family protein [Terasakiella sp. A23]MDV7341518.1 YdiU family protein [Terasakiella sp. A23]